MAKTIVEAPDRDLYERDFNAWAARQAQLLRARRFDELDLEHLIEEVADLGVAEHHAVMSRARQILAHFLKLEHSPAVWPRRGWRETIETQRVDLEDILSPTLRAELERELAHVYARARRSAARDLKQDRIDEKQLPSTCSYTLDQMLDPDWLPKNVHGIDDEPA